jgi:hypothetical protein
MVRPIDRSFPVYADSGEEVAGKIRKDVLEKKLAGGRVYQICPQFGDAELGCCVSVSWDGTMQPVFLDPASGLYSEFRRIRHPAPRAVDEAMNESLEPETVKA